MKNPKPILVTGSHRSGTTWVGRMLATSPSVAYIDEPFNIKKKKGICGDQFVYWYTHINGQNEHKYYRGIKNTIDFRYNLIEQLKAGRSPGYVISQVNKYAQFVRYRLSHTRPLLKDPLALFSAEWLTSRFNMDTVVMIRHPAAFAGSLKEKKWNFPFSHFADQPLLMKGHLQPFEEEIKEFTIKEKDIIDQAALLWKLIHYMILKYERNNPDWIYIRHEDISRDPLAGFRSLFRQLDLDFSEYTEETIRRYSFPRTSTDEQKGNEYQNLKRDSLNNIYSWKDRLSGSEIGRLKSQVQEISAEFYSNDEW